MLWALVAPKVEAKHNVFYDKLTFKLIFSFFFFETCIVQLGLNEADTTMSNSMLIYYIILKNILINGTLRSRNAY